MSIVIEGVRAIQIDPIERNNLESGWYRIIYINTEDGMMSFKLKSQYREPLIPILKGEKR